MSGPLVLAETPDQAREALSRWPDAIVVAMTAGVDAFAERNALALPAIESICDEAALADRAVEIADRVEALSARMAVLGAPLIGPFDPEKDLTLRSYYHNLRTHLDGLVIRAEQVAAAVERVRPRAVAVFGPPAFAMTGLSCLDKPPLGLTQRLLARLAGAQGLALERLPLPEGDGQVAEAETLPAPDDPLSPRNVALARKAEAERLAAALDAARGRLSAASTGQTPPAAAGRTSGITFDWTSLPGAPAPAPVPAAATVASEPRPAAPRRPPPDGPLHLVSSLFSDLGGDIRQAWEAGHGPARTIGELAPEAAPSPAEMARMQQACLAWLRLAVEDGEVARILNWRGIDLRPEVFAQLSPVLRDRFPAMWSDGRRFAAWFAANRAVVLLGGLTDSHYVLARVAGRHGAPVVSYHFGGFLGFALLPIHERYDLAEADYFLCGGAVARRTFLSPSSEARWPVQDGAPVKRARPVPLGLPWVGDIQRKARAGAAKPRPIRRVMVVLNALPGDGRYLGRVFPPEIGYWRFTRDLVERLARENLEIVVKPPLTSRYLQQPNPVEHWIAARQGSGGLANVSFLRETPLTECLDAADAFVIESPSTPLVQLAATRAALAVYADRAVYRVVPEAAALLERRCAVFGQDRAGFFAGLERWLAEIRAGRATTGGEVDDGFLEAVCTGRGEPVTGARMAAFLAEAGARHPLPDPELAALSGEEI